MPEALKTFDRWIGKAANLLGFVGALCLGVLVLVTIISVVARYGLNDPIFGIEDISYMTLSLFVATAVIFGARNNAHVSVNVLSLIAGRRVTRFTDIAVRLLGAGITGVASYALVKKGSCGFKCGAFTPNLEISHQPFYFLLALVMGLFALHFVAQLLIGLHHFTGEDPNEIRD